MRTIGVMNHKWGVGKTTTAINIAAGLSRREKKLVVAEINQTYKQNKITTVIQQLSDCKFSK